MALYGNSPPVWFKWCPRWPDKDRRCKWFDEALRGGLIWNKFLILGGWTIWVLKVSNSLGESCRRFGAPLMISQESSRKMTTTVWSIQCQWSDSQSRYQQHNQQQTQPVSEAFEYRLECDVDRFSEMLCVYLLLSKCYCMIQPIIWGISYPPQKLSVMNIIRTWLGPTKRTEFGTKQTQFGGAYTIDRLKQK